MGLPQIVNKALKSIRILPAIVCLLFTPFAFAQTVCGDRENFLSHLGQNYHESPVELGLSSTGWVVELFTSKDGETWTLLRTAPDGRSCLIAAGVSWGNARKPTPGEPS